MEKNENNFLLENEKIVGNYDDKCFRYNYMQNLEDISFDDKKLYYFLREKTIKSELVFEGKILKVFFDKILLPNLKEATREKVSHPGAVAIVPVTKENQIILVKQYRYPIDKVLIEIPAGKLDSGEPAIKCAERELYEEVGVVGGKIKHLTTVYTSPGFSDELMEIFIAKDFVEKKNNPDCDEFLHIVKYPINECINMIKKGIITDAKSVIGILFTKFLLNE